MANELNTEELLDEVNRQHVAVADLIMVPKKSFCFLEFLSILDSQAVLEALNGTCTLGQNGAPLLMSYCASIPWSSRELWNCALPPGVFLLKDCISDKLEQELLNSLKWKADDEIKSAEGKNEKKTSNDQLKHRQVQHFGYEFFYTSNNVDPECPLLDRRIPAACDSIWDHLASELPQFADFRPDQLTVNRYEPGQGIPPHCDTHSCFEDPILSLSLGSGVVMEFRNPQSSEHLQVLLPRRSLLVMSGEARYGWTHGITPRMSDVIKLNEHVTVVRRQLSRVSFTFRKLKLPPSCSCQFPGLCDVIRPAEKMSEVTDQLAAKLEIENVHKVYNEIGAHFSETRHSPWPNVENFMKSLPKGAVLLDIGCGNGKYLSVNEDNLLKLGCDRSESLLKVCVERNFNVFQCDCLAVPFRDESVDAAISIAVIHHLATRDRRLKAIENMARVLVKGGTALIYVWAKDQQKENVKSTYLLQHNKKSEPKSANEVATFKIDEAEIQLPVHRNRTQFSHTSDGNVLVPWKLKSTEEDERQKVFLRYYHVFDEGELENLCSELPNIEIVRSYYDQGNHCVVLKKKL